jgi:hypothetical protein
MNISLLLVTALLAVSPARAAAADVCAPYASMLNLQWRLGYERPDGPSRAARLDKSECTTVTVSESSRDMDPTPTEYSEARLRFWADGSPYELSVELSGGFASVVLMKRNGTYSRVMARVDRLPESELASTVLDYTGDVADGEYPELRAGRGVRRTVRSGRVVLTPVKR